MSLSRFDNPHGLDDAHTRSAIDVNLHELKLGSLEIESKTDTSTSFICCLYRIMIPGYPFSPLILSQVLSPPLICHHLYGIPIRMTSYCPHVHTSQLLIIRSLPFENSAHSSLHSLNWLKITLRIQYKILTLITYKSLQYNKPSPIFDLLTIQPTRSTRSSAVVTLQTPYKSF